VTLSIQCNYFVLMGVRPTCFETESRFVSPLIANLNSNMYINIDLLPDLASGTELNAVPSSFVRFRGSHAARMAGLMQCSLPSFTRVGWGTGGAAVEAMALDVKENVDSLPASAVAPAV
jgi:hypothetical protein